MKVAVMGTGGVGGFFGAKLAKAGEEVTLIARGGHLSAIRLRGLQVKSAREGEFTVNAPATDDPSSIGPVDLVLFSVKSYDTEAAARRILPLISRDTVVLTVQNGVDNAEKIARITGPEHVLAGSAYVFSIIEAPGVIRHTSGGQIVFGELDGEESDRSSGILAALTRAGISAERSRQIQRVLWEKYLFITVLGGMTALTRCPIGPIRSTPETRQMLKRLFEEIAALASASGAPLAPDAWERALSMADRLPPTAYSSLHHDLIHGRRLEIEALQGYAVRLGERFGIPTPMLFAVYAALKPSEHGAPSP